MEVSVKEEKILSAENHACCYTSRNVGSIVNLRIRYKFTWIVVE